jgi:hypothetical protein
MPMAAPVAMPAKITFRMEAASHPMESTTTSIGLPDGARAW